MSVERSQISAAFISQTSKLCSRKLRSNKVRSSKLRSTKLLGLIAVSAVTLGLAGCGTGSKPAAKGQQGTSSSTSSSQTKKLTQKWMKINSSSKTVVLTLIGAMNNKFNFNGYENGFMTIHVPSGWHVQAVFTNKGHLPNSATIVPYSQVKNHKTLHPAFSGSTSPHPHTGAQPGVTQRFQFTASKPGTYAVVSATSGMWDYFVVTKGGSPYITVK